MQHYLGDAEGRGSDRANTTQTSHARQFREACSLERYSLAGQPVHRPIIVANGPHTGERLTLAPIGPEFIDRMIKLQDTDESGNTIFRDETFLSNMLNRGDKAFGLLAKDGSLAGQIIVRSDMALLPDALCDKFNDASLKHAYIGSIVVHPDYKGSGLMGHMVKQCLKEATSKGNTDVHARVVVGNDACLSNFKKHFNFEVILTTQSPDSTEPRIVNFLHRKL